MRRLMTPLTRTVAVLVIAAAPTLAIAQISQANAAAQPNPAADHLAAARGLLNKILNAPAPTGDAFKKLSDIKTHYLALEKAASTAAPEWKTHYTEIDRLAGELLATPDPETPVGTSGRTDAPRANALDPALETNLRLFRTHLTAFAASIPAPAPTATATPAPTPPAAPTPAAPTPPTAATEAPAESSQTAVAAQVDQAIALVDGALNANARATTISIDRTVLEQLKTQLEQIKQGVKKQ